MKYHGITHAIPMLALPLWRRFMCKRNIHCFDEVYSHCFEIQHYLSCDACDLIVNIESINTEYVTPNH